MGTPILAWKQTTQGKVIYLPCFDRPGHEFLFRLDAATNKRFLARSVHSFFVGMHSNEPFCRVREPTAQRIFTVRRRDFKLCREEKLPSISTLLDDMAPQYEREKISQHTDGPEEVFYQVFMAETVRTAFSATVKKTSDPNVLKTFAGTVFRPEGVRSSTGNVML